MGVNKVLYGDETLVDLTGDTVTPQTLAEGTTAHGADGEPIVGTMPTDVVRYGEQTLTDEQKTQARSNIGLGNIDNTADADKVVKEAGTLTNLTATVEELNYVDGVKSNIQTQLDGKLGDFTILLYNGNKGNPNPVRFASFNYSTCNSENGIAAKISMVSGHGNGSSYAFLQDVIIKVSHTGAVSVDNFKYYGAETGTYDGANRQYGDIFWLIDTTNKIVDFYCLMGQYARVYQTPWKRLTYSTGGAVTQHTSCTVYSSGDKTWGNNSEIALLSDIPTVPSKTDVWTFTYEDGTTETKEVYIK